MLYESNITFHVFLPKIFSFYLIRSLDLTPVTENTETRETSQMTHQTYVEDGTFYRTVGSVFSLINQFYERGKRKRLL